MISQEQWLTELPSRTTVTGPGLKRVSNKLPERVAIARRELWEPSAASIARLANLELANGHEDDPWSLKPVYFRRSAAEEKMSGPGE